MLPGIANTTTLTQASLTGCAVCRKSLKARCVDASDSSAYNATAPADLLIVSGVMGNLAPTDVRSLIQFAASLCAPRARLIWNRSSKHPDLGVDIRRWFAESGFKPLALHEGLGGTTMRVGVESYAGAPLPQGKPRQLFTFLQ